MRLQKIMGITVVLALLTAVAAALSATPTRTIIARFLAVLVLGGFGLAVARENQLQGSVFLGSQEWSLTIRDIVNYGVLPGLVLGLINFFFFFPYRYSPSLQVPKTAFDSFVVSLYSGVLEEVFFRLFILSAFLSAFRYLYSRLSSLWPSVVAVLPKALAVVVSTLLFAMAHNIYGFTAAFFGGMLLGLIYIQSGIESAIAAHFCANFLFFSASYLS